MRPALLHVHSNFSFMWGANRMEEIFKGAAKRGWRAIAVTDINNLCGLREAVRCSKETGVRLIVGADLRIGGEHAVALATSPAGFANLCETITGIKAAENGTWRTGGVTPPLHLTSHVSHPEGLIFLTRSLETAAALRECGARVRLEVGGTDIRTADAAARIGLRAVASRPVTFVGKGDREIHLLLRAIASNSALNAPPDAAPPGAFMPPAVEFMHGYGQMPEAVREAENVAAECAFEYAPPPPDIPGPETDPAEAKARLRRLAYEGALLRYGTAGGRVGERLEHELGLIESKGFSGYFLIIKDVTDRFSRTCGRGSGAASCVAYCLGITGVDPIRHNLYFERFLNPGRTDPPDLDVDFAWDERDGALEYVLGKYGPARAAMISTHVTFGPRMAIREVAKVYGIPDGEIGRVTRRLPWFFGMDGGEGDADPEASEAALLEELRSLPQLKGTEFPPPWPEIISRASRIAGFPRHLSVHCGGVVISSGDIRRLVPVERAPKGVPVVQWEKDASEDFGLVKIDLLGNRSLAVIRDAIADIRSNGALFDDDSWDPESDAATVDLLARGDSMGVFYVESPAMRQLQKKTGRGDFEHLVIHSSIIRPAANAYIREYVRRLKGGAWKPLHPLLENVLSETFGIMCYQEDVSRAAIALAGFSHAEGDALRKVLSKKDRARRLPDFRARFTAGAEANGVDAATALKVWEMMESFAGYSFCKPHSASYAKVSFQSAYLKAHHPAEFIAAVISNRGGYYTTFAYVSEAARMGLRVLPPDVNRSRREFYGRGREVRTGLMQIKGLSDASISSILDARAAAGPFGSVDDFARRTRLPRPESESLALAGAMDSLAGGMTRPQILWKLCALEPEKPRRMKTMELFDAPSPAPHGRPSIPPLPEYTPARLRGLEMDRLGYLCSDHPLCHYLPRRPGLKYVKGSDLGAHRGRRVRTIGWLVTGKLVYSRHGEPMEFVSFEDTHAVYETTFFPGAFAKFAHMLDRTRPYVLTGKVDEDFGAVSLTVEEAEFL